MKIIDLLTDEARAALTEPHPDVVRSYKPEVIADNSGKWTGNALRFKSRDAAETYVKGLASRWFAVIDTRVVESDDEPTEDA